MKTFINTAAQGDVFFRRIDTIPSGAKEILPNERNEIVVTHSETGHDHVMVLDSSTEPAARLFSGANPLVAWLQVNRPTSLDHKREAHKHESILFQPGMYEIRRQQEQRPEGWRRVAD